MTTHCISTLHEAESETFLMQLLSSFIKLTQFAVFNKYISDKQ